MKTVVAERLKEIVDGKAKTKLVEAGGFKWTVRADLTIEERVQIVNTAVENAYIGQNMLCPTAIKAAFQIAFVKAVYQNLPLPMKEAGGGGAIDTQASLGLIGALGLIERYAAEANDRAYGEVWDDVEQAVAFENGKRLAYLAASGSASDKAVEAFAGAFGKLSELLDRVSDLVGQGGGKLSKMLAAKKLDGWMDGLVEAVAKHAASSGP